MPIQNTIATVPEQGTNINREQLVTNDLPSPSTDDSIVFVADGEWEDPRKDVTGKFVEDYGERVNAVGKLQRSIAILLPDGSKMLVSGFGANARKLAGLKLGSTYAFKGRLKAKTEIFQGKEKASHFLNL